MASAGELVVTLTSDQAGFVSGMREASSEVDKFGEHTSEAGKHAHAAGGHVHGLNHVLGTTAAIAGTSAGEMKHLAHAFELAPGPIGIAIAALLVFKTALDGIKERAKLAAEESKKAYKAFHESQNFLKGEKDTENQKQLDALKETISAERQKIIGLQHSILSPKDAFTSIFGSSSDAVKKMRKDIDVLESQADKLRDKMKKEKDTGQESIEKTKAFHSLEGVSGASADVFKFEHTDEGEQLKVLQRIADNTAPEPKGNPNSAIGK